MVELVDIAPTVLDAAEIDIPYYMQGKTLMPLLRGESDLHSHKDSVVTEFNDALGSAQFSLPTHATMNFDGRYKTIVYHGHGFGELFDLENDPCEMENLHADPARREEIAALRERLLDWSLFTCPSPVHLDERGPICPGENAVTFDDESKKEREAYFAEQMQKPSSYQ